MVQTGTTTSTVLSNEVKTVYDSAYLMAGQSNVYFDQFAYLRMVTGGVKGQTIEFPILESLQPTTGVLDETVDVSPQTMTANVVDVKLVEYGGALEITKYLTATSYVDIAEQAAYANGYSMAESLDLVVRAVAGQGSRVFYQNSAQNSTRSTIQGQGTPANHGSADRLNDTFVQFLSVLAARSLKMPLYPDGSVCTVLHPFIYYDLLQSTNITTLATRTEPELLFNGELAYWSGMRIIVSANAKGFYGAGAAPGGNPVASASSTLSAVSNPGDTTITLVSGTNFAAGQWIGLLDGTETGNTWFDTNEALYVTNVASNVLTVFALDPGPGDGGGVRYSHGIGTVVNNNNSVWPVVVMGPSSITKAASDMTGPYGETIVSGPYDRLARFLALGWYLIAGYARTKSGWLLRGEVGSATY